MGMSSQQQKPVFAEGQKDAAGQIIQQILLPALFGGAPDAATEAGINRSQQAVGQQLASQGLTGSGLAARAAADVQKGALEARANQRFDMINRIFSPMGGQSTGGTGPLGFTGFGGRGFGMLPGS